MPELNVLCACDRVIIDGKGIPSLINLFQRLDLQLQDTPLPENAVAPARWFIYSQWQLAPDEVGKDFVQHTKVLKPDGTDFHEATQPFRVDSDIDLQVRTYVEFNGMPVGQEGRIRVLTWLGDEPNRHEFSLYIKHVPRPDPVVSSQLDLAAASE